MHEYMHACIHAYTYTHTHTYTQTLSHAHKHTWQLMEECKQINVSDALCANLLGGPGAPGGLPAPGPASAMGLGRK
jgi:hypothetical protein